MFKQLWGTSKGKKLKMRFLNTRQHGKDEPFIISIDGCLFYVRMYLGSEVYYIV